jgi:predicted MFS family arabinose efflux permease
MDSPSYPRRAIVALSVFVAVAYGTQLYALSVLITVNAAGGEFSISLLSAAFGGAAIVAGVLAPRVGRIADQHSVRGLMATGALLGGAALMLVSVANAEWQVVVVFWVLLGPSTAMTFYEPAYVAIGQWVSTSQRNRAIALLSLVAGFAGPVFIPLTGWMVTSFGWRWAAAALGGTLALVGGGGAFLLLPKGRPRGVRRQQTGSVQWRRFLTDRRLMAFSGAVILSFAVINTVFLHRVAVFEEAGFDVKLVAVLAGFSSLLTFPGRWFAPRIAERIQPIRIFIVSLWILAAVMVLAIIGEPTMVMWAFFVLFGIFFGALLPMRAVIMNDWYAGDDYGLLMGKQWAVAAVAGGAMPWLAGVLRDLFNGYEIPMLVVVVGMSAAALLGSVAHRASDVEAGRAASEHTH